MVALFPNNNLHVVLSVALYVLACSNVRVCHGWVSVKQLLPLRQELLFHQQINHYKQGISRCSICYGKLPLKIAKSDDTTKVPLQSGESSLLSRCPTAVSFHASSNIGTSECNILLPKLVEWMRSEQIILAHANQNKDNTNIPLERVSLPLTGKMPLESMASLPPGVTGRVLLVTLTADNNDDDFDPEEIGLCISNQIDELIHSSSSNDNADDAVLSQPILVSVLLSGSDEETIMKQNPSNWMVHLIYQQIEDYDLANPIVVVLPSEKQKDDISSSSSNSIIPSSRIKVDGAYIEDVSLLPVDDDDDSNNLAIKYDKKKIWDTSDILIYDDLVSKDLRRKLRMVVNGNDYGDEGDRLNPDRWVRGGLTCLPEDDAEEQQQQQQTSLGLSPEATFDISFRRHDAIQEFERTVLNRLFPDCIVSRQPEAVWGDSVTPLTANAALAGDDSYDYHIDGDPFMTPPSPWTDIYGRYPNRSRGKPRMVTCLVYINDEWNWQEWGAPTRCLDVATNTEYDVQARPGRVVIMDQDITHTVVAPTAAVTTPRYSLVWKLILHPKEYRQDMSSLKPVREDVQVEWPDPQLIGSARKIENHEEKRN